MKPGMRTGQTIMVGERKLKKIGAILAFNVPTALRRARFKYRKVFRVYLIQPCWRNGENLYGVYALDDTPGIHIDWIK